MSELATIDSSTELTPEQQQQLEALEASAAADVRSKIDQKDLVLPMLKVGQALSDEVANGDARPGNLINSLTGDVYEGEVEVVLVDTFKGRFFKPEKDSPDTYTAPGDVMPLNWPHPDAGKPFAESSDAEEKWVEAANAGDIEWGSGPPIQTTHNFVGFIVGDDSGLPMRLSFKSAATPQARKLNTLLTTSRTPWANVYKLTTTEETNSANQRFYVPNVKRGRATKPAERLAAAQLYEELKNSEIVLAGDEESEAPAAPEPAQDGSAIDVS